MRCNVGGVAKLEVSSTYSSLVTRHSSLAKACGLLVLLDGRGEGGGELVGQHLLLADLLQDLPVRGAQELVQPLPELLVALDRPALEVAVVDPVSHRDLGPDRHRLGLRLR